MASPAPLDRIPLLEALPPADRARLEGCLAELRLPAGAPVFGRGDPGDRLFVVVEGTVEAFLPAEGGSARVVLGRLGPGAHFGELAVERLLRELDELRRQVGRGRTPPAAG